VGPGAYGSSKFKHIIKENSPSMKQGVSGTLLFSTRKDGLQASANNIFGNEKRFKEAKRESPGPGQYADSNKWHKKTYNLKFLNVA
jgi:hypothetical protein